MTSHTQISAIRQNSYLDVSAGLWRLVVSTPS